MASWEPVDIDPARRDEMGEEDNQWGNVLRNDLQRRFNELRQFDKRLETSSDENFGEITLELEKNKVKEDTIELVANQMYDEMTMLINDRRKPLGKKGGTKIVEPIRNSDSFDLDDNGNLTFVRKNEVLDLGNISEGLNSPSKMIK